MKEILLVDDNLFMQEIIADFLRNRGFKVDACANGKQASVKLRNNRYDLILTDLHMPVEDGFTFIDKFLGSVDTPFIAMTSGDDAPAFQDKLKTLEQAGVKVINKPFSKEFIYGLVNKILFLENSQNAKN